MGAGYLAWIGLSSFLPDRADDNDGNHKNQRPPSTNAKAFRTGFLCNALNPKTALFFLALFTQVVSPTTPLQTQLFLGAFIALAHFVWFASVAVLLTHHRLDRLILKSKRRIEKITGACLVLLGVKLLFYTT